MRPPIDGTGAHRSLGLHAALAAFVLVSVSLWVGLEGYFFIDEAAFYGQLEVLDDGDWVVESPSVLADEPDHVPMARSHVTEDGFAPFVKHPVHVRLAELAEDVGGRTGVRASSTVGVIVAAALAGALAERSRRGAGPIALWLTALCSPLLFQAQLVVGHALGAGVAALLLWCVFAFAPRPAAVPVTAALGAAGTLIRSEFLLLAASVALVVVVRAVLTRERSRTAGATAGLAGLAGAAAAWLLEPFVVERWVGGDASSTVISSASRGGLGGALEGAQAALVDVGPGSTRSLVALIVTSTVVVAAVWKARSAPTDGVPVLLLGFVATAAAVTWLTDSEIVPGLLFAFPALGLLVALPRLRGDDVDALLLLVAAAFAGAVLVTQYRVAGGGVEWGWRYFSIALPAVAPALAVALLRLWHGATGATARLGLSLVVLAAVLVPLGGVVAQKRYLRETDRFLDRVVAAADDTSFVVSTDASFGRFAYPVSVRGRSARVTAENATSLLSSLAADGVEPVLLVWRGDLPSFDLGDYAVRGAEVDLRAGYRAVHLSNVRSPS